MLKQLLIISIVIIEFVTCDYVLQTDVMTDRKLFPILSNGKIGFRPFDEYIYITGVYSGEGADSHLAKIPNLYNIYMEQCTPFIAAQINCTYAMDMKRGVFSIKYRHTDYQMQQLIYVHRHFQNIVVLEFDIDNWTNANLYNISLIHWYPMETEDVKLGPVSFREIEGRQVSFCRGTIKSFESITSTQHEDVFIMWLQIPENFLFNTYGSKVVFVMLIDTRLENLVTDITEVLQSIGFYNRIYNLHVSAWYTFWDSHDIVISGNEPLATAIHSSLYSLASNMPLIGSGENNMMCGLSATGFSNSIYKSQTTWYSELAIVQPMILIQPEHCKELLWYRYNSLSVAEERAYEKGFNGVKYPSRMACTGEELTQSINEERYDEYTTPIIGFVLKLMFAATQDLDLMDNIGCDISYEIGKYLASRVTYNALEDIYEFKNVMGLDNNFVDISNDFFINFVTKLTIAFNHYASCICKDILNREEMLTIDNWLEIAEKLILPRSNHDNRHIQYDNYDNKTLFNYSNIILLNYLFNGNSDILEINKNLLHTDIPLINWTFLIIDYLKLNEREKADALLKKINDYQVGPFLLWRELTSTNSVINFLPNAGLILQMLLNGYMGITVHLNYLEINNIKLPKDVIDIKLNGLYYLNNLFSMRITSDNMFISFRKLNPLQKLQMIIDEKNVDIYQGYEYNITQRHVILQPLDKVITEKCILSLNDTIIEPGGDKSSAVHVSIIKNILLINLIIIFTY